MKPSLIVLQQDNAGAVARIHASGFDKPWSAAEFRQLLEKPTVLALGIEAEEHLAAFILVQMTPDTGDILTLTTAPKHRRKGHAKHLVRAALSRLGERGIATILLDVAADNEKALALYRELGFRQTNIRRGYYDRSDKSRVDAILMSRQVAGQWPAGTA